MADVGTIVGIISLGIQVVDGLVKYYTAYKDRESETAHTVKRLNHLLGVLEILRKQLACRKFQPDEKSLLEAIEGSVGDCEGLINELQQETEKFTRTPSTGVAAAVRVTGRRLAYPFRQSTLQKLDEDIDEICTNLTLALQLLQQEDLRSVQDEIQDTRALLDLVRSSQLSAEKRDWLKAPDASINYNDACKKKHPGTGLWFTKSPQFSTWLGTPNSFLWLKGFAGCGKSVLSSTIIQQVMRHRQSNPSIGIAFFYFTFNDESKQDTSAMLRALILQLGVQFNSHDSLRRLHESYRGSTPPDRALLGCVQELVGKFDDVYIILDALDESPRHKHREDVLRVLTDMRSWPGRELHLLVTSRDEPDIREHLEPPDDQVVSMKNASVDADIASFVSDHLKDNRRLRKWEKHHDQIQRALTEGAKGVFRWVECQFAALEACPGSKTRLDALLGSLPRNLDKTYERMLLNIEEESADDAKRILTLLCTAKRPLAVAELIDGIAVELGDEPMFNEDSRLMNEDDIRHICPGFIEVDLQAGDDEMTVRIAHYSVQEYLESDRILNSGMAKFSVRREDANTQVACICLAYLLDPEVSDAYLTLRRDFYPRFPLVTYAASHWPEHYREGQGSDPLLHRLALKLFHDDEVALVGWANLFGWAGYKREGLGNGTLSPLYFAARLGLDPVVRVLAEESASDPSYKRYFGSALVAAAVNGHATAVKLLLDYGADIEYRGFRGTALHAAVRESHTQVVEALLDRGANVETEDYNGTTALYHGAFSGEYEIVRLLIDSGANINPPGPFQTPLECAASRGHQNIVAMLLDHGADPNYGRKYLPLVLAVGSAQVVRLLVDRGADVNKDRDILREASRSDSPEDLALLLDLGADVSKAGGFAHLLEYAAARTRPNPEVVKLLLDRGADVDEGETCSPLKTACESGGPEILTLLLDRGADVSKAGGFGCLLECAASAREWPGNAAMVRLLLDRGANANDGTTCTPLEAAISSRTEAVVKLLLDRGADVNRGQQRTPLEKAAAEGWQDGLELLLERGADPDLGIQMTPLEAAAGSANERAISVLLEKGAGANKGIARTPLEALMSGGYGRLKVPHRVKVDWGKGAWRLVLALLRSEPVVNPKLGESILKMTKGKGFDFADISDLLEKAESQAESEAEIGVAVTVEELQPTAIGNLEPIDAS